MFDNIKKFIGFDDEDYEDEYEDEEESTVEENTRDNRSDRTLGVYSGDEIKSSYSDHDSFTSETKREANIVSLMDNGSKSSLFKISVQEPVKYDEAKIIVDEFKKNRVIVLNLEMAEPEDKKRIFDFVSGAVYAYDGQFHKVAKGIFVFSPRDIDIEGKLTNELSQGAMYRI